MQAVESAEQEIQNDPQRYYKLYPLDAPELPAPGPDFIAHAIALGDRFPDPKGDRDHLLNFADDVASAKKLNKKDLIQHVMHKLYAGSRLEDLYRTALYVPGFAIPVTHGARRDMLKFVPGHLWKNGGGSYGPCPADVMIVGKHPGHEEVNSQFNFCGKTSAELARALDDLKVAPEELDTWYATNVVRYLPPGEKGDTLSAGDLKNCMPLLAQELRLVQPRFLLCLGGDAAKAILGRHIKMQDTVGRVYTIEIPLHQSEEDEEEYHEIKVVCCAHPARIAREPELYERPEFLGAIKMFVNLWRGKVLDSGVAGEHDIVYTAEELDKVCRKAADETLKGGAFALDCEWEGRRPGEPNSYLRTVQFSHKPGYACAIVLYGDEAPNSRLSPELVGSYLRSLLTPVPGRPIRIVGHNLKSDLPWLKSIGVDLKDAYGGPRGTKAAQRTKTEGGFDTLLAAHAVSETGPFKLEVLACQHLGVMRYDAEKEDFLDQYCEAKKIGRDELTGYGCIPERILLPYSLADAQVTRELFDVYNGVGDKPGLLDEDRFGNNCREAFLISQRAAPVALEIETTGVLVDLNLAETLIDTFLKAAQDILAKLREAIKWPEFNPESPYHRNEMIFGEKYGKKDKAGKSVRVRPEGAISLNLTPVVSTEGRAWKDAGPNARAAANKMALSILSPASPEVALLRDYRVVKQVTKSLLRPGEQPEDPEEDKEYDGGLLSYVAPDQRVRTMIFPVETGRWSSSKPNLMNISSRRDADYKRILGEEKFRPMRHLFAAEPGWVLIDPDYTGAELAVTAWLCGDKTMIEHVRRSGLPEDDPDYFDIHSSIAVRSFGLNCPPTKGGLKKIGAAHLRIAAKRRIFGLFYGQGDEAALLQIHEEGAPSVTLEQVKQTTAGIHEQYRGLQPFFDLCKQRVKNPGWICNPFGSYRRFFHPANEEVLANLERQAMNFPIQSTVAKAMETALYNLLVYREREKMRFRILLQIHDAVMLEVPFDEVQKVYYEAIPWCMVQQVPIFACDLDGVPIDTTPHYFAVDRKLGFRWGEELDKETAALLGVVV